MRVTHEPGLIFDVGAHAGEDTDFYLKKGFRVVAVEANPELAAGLRERFAAALADRRLVIEECAIAEEEGMQPFYLNKKHSVWGTLRPDWAERNARMGGSSRQVMVRTVRFASLLQRHGIPYYLKIDIEGLDPECLRALLEVEGRPAFLSIESSKTSWADLAEEFTLLQRLGYRKFQIVNQEDIPLQREPMPAHEGETTDYRFPFGSSGLFGRDLPGRWLSAAQALHMYRGIFLRYRFFGDNTLGNRIVSRLPSPFRALLPRWYDTHAALS